MQAYLPLNGRRTSRAAADGNETNSGNQRSRIYRLIVQHGGATDEELSEATGIKPDSVRPRRGELVELGFVRDSGQTRKNRAGEQVIVWLATGLPYDEAQATRKLHRLREQPRQSSDRRDPDLQRVLDAYPKLSPERQTIIQDLCRAAKDAG